MEAFRYIHEVVDLDPGLRSSRTAPILICHCTLESYLHQEVINWACPTTLSSWRKYNLGSRSQCFEDNGSLNFVQLGFNLVHQSPIPARNTSCVSITFHYFSRFMLARIRVFNITCFLRHVVYENVFCELLRELSTLIPKQTHLICK